MSIERLFLTDPYNEHHINMIKEFEQENTDSTKISDELKKISTTISKEDYEETKKKQNEIEIGIFVEKNSKITEYGQIQGEKDIKTCRITFIPIKNKEKKRKLPLLATEYALKSLGIEEVFIDVSKEDVSMIKSLEMNNFENLGDNNGKLLFLKEQEIKTDTQRKIA